MRIILKIYIYRIYGFKNCMCVVFVQLNIAPHLFPPPLVLSIRFGHSFLKWFCWRLVFDVLGFFPFLGPFKEPAPDLIQRFSLLCAAKIIYFSPTPSRFLRVCYDYFCLRCKLLILCSVRVFSPFMSPPCLGF